MLPTTHPAFVPPFCPNPSCRHHRDQAGWRWRRDGTHSRKATPHEVRRFRCRNCGRSFSTQTFDTTYWLKRPELQQPLFHALVACAAFRQMGRSLRAAGTSLQRQASRLGRHSLLFNQANRPQVPPTENLVLDGLVSFEFAQYWPFEMNVVVGVESFFAYGFTDAELRRSGAMTPEQKAKRDRLERLFGRPDPQATRKSIEALVPLAVPPTREVEGNAECPPIEVTIRSDEHQAYPRAFRNLPRYRIHHRTVTSRRCRTMANPLFAVDHFDLLVRHSSANHKRETIAFSKRRQGALERLAALVTWRNFMKRKSEQRLDSPCPAMALGLIQSALRLDTILIRRLFPTLIPLPTPHDKYYWRLTPTRAIPNGTSHRLKYAF